MHTQDMLENILDSFAYPIVFVDDGYIIRFMNRYARYCFYQERGYAELLGKSIFDCHDYPASNEKIKKAYEKMKKDGKDYYVGVNVKHQRVDLQGVRNAQGELIGFIERFEINVQLPPSGY
jgi:nitrogen-specific signal transduction histidine kinase